MAICERRALVIDNGSGMTKAGVSGSELPEVVFPTVIGYSTSETNKAGQTTYIGRHALVKKLKKKDVHYPIEHGFINNKNEMERIWHHTFNELGFAPQDNPVLFTERPGNYKKPEHREKMMTEIMFKNLQTSAIYIANTAVLSLFATGKTTGIVVGSGDSLTYACPVYEGTPLTEAVKSLKFGGRDLDGDFSRDMPPEQIIFQEDDYNLLCDMKEKLCFVAFDIEKERLKEPPSFGPEKFYQLPDGRVIDIGKARFECPEYLFHPLPKWGKRGVHGMCYESIMKCDVAFHHAMFGNIVLEGGSTMFQGFKERFHKEMNLLANQTSKSKYAEKPRIEVKVIAPATRKYLAWIGGSILASLSTFQGMCITKEEYDEVGFNIVLAKCPFS